MPSIRRYHDPCGIARAMDVVGERWALLVIRELIFGPKRFVQLRHGLHGVSPNILSQRLHDLEAAGVVRRYTLDPPRAAPAPRAPRRPPPFPPRPARRGRGL